MISSFWVIKEHEVKLEESSRFYQLLTFLTNPPDHGGKLFHKIICSFKNLPIGRVIASSAWFEEGSNIPFS